MAVAELSTSRLILIPLAREMIAAWVARPGFTLYHQTMRGWQELSFPPEWPGDAAAIFPSLLDAMSGETEVPGSFAIVELASQEVVGLAGTKGGPDPTGVIEIGYGLNPQSRGRGLATEAVGALVTHLLGQPGISTVTAQTAVHNVASQRVLEKVGFRRIGTDWSPQDGDLIEWSCQAPTTPM